MPPWPRNTSRGCHLPFPNSLIAFSTSKMQVKGNKNEKN